MSVELDEGHDGEDDEDHRGADRPADLQARVAVDLRRHGALARLELEQRLEQRALDAEEDDERDREDELVERVDVVGVGRAGVVLRGEEGPERRGGEQQGEDHRGHGRNCGATGQHAQHGRHEAPQCIDRPGRAASSRAPGGAGLARPEDRVPSNGVGPVAGSPPLRARAAR